MRKNVRYIPNKDNSMQDQQILKSVSNRQIHVKTNNSWFISVHFHHLLVCGKLSHDSTRHTECVPMKTNLGRHVRRAVYFNLTAPHRSFDTFSLPQFLNH